MSPDTTKIEDRPVILSLAGLSKAFGSTKAVDDISLTIPEGEFLTIVGPSGSGKSTLVRLLAGLETPTGGDLFLHGVRLTDTPANKRPTAMVFQSLALFDHRTVGQNIEFAMKMRGVPTAVRRDRARELLQLVRLPADYYSRPVTQCSGGERQRVALARAFASDPEILFFDEPLSAIDYRLRKTLEVELKELHQRTGRTFVYITHSLEEAMVMSDRIAIMQDGRIIQTGTPAQIYGAPANRFVASFMGEVNILTIEHKAGDQPIFAEIDQPIDNPKGAYAMIRPEALAHGPGEISAQLTVTQRLMLGSRTQVHLLSDKGATLISELPGTAPELQIGTTHMFSFAASDIAWMET